MSFLNAILLGGAGALIVPLLLHLLNRSRFHTIDWGAMHLLEAALESNSRRVQWESWLLLLVRCLIPVLLAMTLARPVLTHLRQAGADGKKSLVLLLDNSFSMAATEDSIAAGESLLSRASRELLDIAERAEGAELSLWTTAEPARDLLEGTTVSVPRLRAALPRIGPPAGITRPVEAIELGLRQLPKLSESNRQIILASDFQAAQWRALSDNDVQALRTQITSTDSATQLFLFCVRSSGPGPNLSIEIIDAPHRARPDQSVQLSARVTNHDTQPVSDVVVTFEAEGRDLASRTLQLTGSASEQVEFACEFTQLGNQRLSVHVADRGSVHADDTWFHIVRVAPSPKLLIVDDSLDAIEARSPAVENLENDKSFRGTSRFLQLALSPFADRSQNPFVIDRASATQLRRESLAAYDGVIVANIETPTRNLVELVADYANAGGGLLFFAPSEFNAAAWQQTQNETTQLLPLQFNVARTTTDARPTKLDVTRTSPISTSSLALPTGGLSDIEFTRWWELTRTPLQIRSMDSPRGSPQVPSHVLLEFSTGEPWLVEQEVGQGLVVQCASSCADDGTNLPNQPAYVPLMLWLTERIVNHAVVLAQEGGDDSLATLNPPREESQLTPLNVAELETLAARLGATIIESADDYIRTENIRRDGWEFWRWLLVGVLGLMFAELLIAQRNAIPLSRGLS